MKITALITAGGSSKRFGSNKLLEKIGQTSVIEKTINAFLKHPNISEVVVSAGQELEKFLNNKNLNIKIIQGGPTRQDSVYRGLKACSSPDFVLIHDGARPFISEETITKAIETVVEKKAAIVAVRVKDTIKTVDQNGLIINTPDRKTLWQAQTPQCFEYKTILEIHKNLEGQDFTDDASMAEHMSQNVYICEGNYSNIKITTVEDLNF